MSKMINCKTCNAEVASSAKTCPNCGAKNKKPWYKKWWVWVVIVIGVSVIGNLGEDKSTIRNIEQTSNQVVESGVEETKSLSKEEKENQKEEQAVKEIEELISIAQEYDYNDIERNPDDYKGKPAKIKGKVIQVSEGMFNTVIYRIATKEETDNIFYVTYKRPEGETRVLENDIVTVYGILDGVTTYTSVLAGQITVPAMKAKRIAIEE